jgi:hypothetical protein
MSLVSTRYASVGGVRAVSVGGVIVVGTGRWLKGGLSEDSRPMARVRVRVCGVRVVGSSGQLETQRSIVIRASGSVSMAMGSSVSRSVGHCQWQCLFLGVPDSWIRLVAGRFCGAHTLRL